MQEVEMMMERKWKESGVDVVNLILAVFLFLTPWIFGFVSDHAAVPNAWVSGIVIGVVAIAALSKFAEWEECIILVLGVLVLLSRWVLRLAVAFIARWAYILA